MTTDQIKQKHKLLLTSRFEQVIYFTIAMIFLATISTYTLDRTNIRLVTLLIFDICLMSSLFSLVKNNQINLAKQIYIWINLFVLSFIFWDMGGLLSSAVILVFPIFLMTSALLGGRRTFVLTFSFAVCFITFVSVYAIVNNTNSITTVGFGYWELSIVVILLSANGYTAWRFNDDMRYALRKLRSQVEAVNNSRSEIERLLHFDSLTGLSSRLNSEEKYITLTSDSDNTPYKLSFLFLDLDNFKAINDYYDHSTGDEVLKIVAHRLIGLIRENDVACRLSGDEFLIILKRPDNYNIEQLCKRILQQVSEPAEIFGSQIEITASLGISIYDFKQNESFESLLKKADLAMYRAKELGRNRYAFYDESFHIESQRNNNIIKGLKSALKNEDLELYLQPKIDIVTGKAQSAEALIRWVRNNPDNISPAEFIPLIESTELICMLGEWVISRACTLCKDLHNKGYEGISVSVNISSAQFVRGGLEKIILRELQQSDLEPQYLELELTEHVLFNDNVDVYNELIRIKELGVALSIDDFGTGYSNLGYLTKFKVDTLKIDQSFIRDIDSSSASLAIVNAIIKMAKTLGLSIVAEGVETQQEWDVLKKLGCDQGQGFFWSKPLSSIDFLEHMSETV